MLYLIGLGLGKDSVSCAGLKIVNKCKEVYLEDYTSVMEGSLEDLKKLFKKKIAKVDRNFVEKSIKVILKKANKENIAFLVMGDDHSETTHIDLYLRAKKEKILIEVIPGVSILTAIGITGLSLYNFGKVISIPFNNENIKSPYKNFQINWKNSLHTLFLLDLDPKNNKFLTIKEACHYLINSGADKNTIAVGCARIGFRNFKIKKGSLISLQHEDFGKPPYCLIVPSKLHFMEEEALSLWK